MSANENQSVNSNSVSLNQNRAEFLEKFQEKYNNSKSYQNGKKGRWNYLYNQSKLRKMKEEEYRKKQIEKREKDLFAECTFNPILNKNTKYNNNKYLISYQGNSPDQNKSNSQYIPDISTRQNTWIQKKALRIEALKQFETNKELEECCFKPETNPRDKTSSKNFYSEAAEVLEDPESYSLYINRLNNKRKAEESKTQREKSAPGSGYLWNPKPKKYDFKYDYTKHEISSRGFAKSKSIKSLDKPGTPNKFNLKVTKSSKQFKVDKDKYYDYLYSSKRSQTEGPYYGKETEIHENTLTNNNVKILSFSKEIEFGKALEILHNELFSFKLMKDE